MATPLLEASTDINAGPAQVWAIISDLKRMGEWSPQCRKVIVVGGEVKQGARTINVNRRGLLTWPTTATVVTFAPEKAIAFRITENRTVWSYEITPTPTGVRLTERREAAGGKTTALSSFLVSKALGGNDSFEAELQEGMRETLVKIKAAAEKS
ncbi:SRPBCC family protein [Williamsia sp. CHRR-6]|uniref:SRPBCC family protein n=1 Tax=Williamsia sp. CHRR-6 TaxID=2835871 RepID=UPI001BD9AF3F|nr:SRPBCC family protein [Williamsia sp. CHRR-6]MBT0567012.1 SRPBCC family protein [Williamsia sp. CHRR-6]